MRQDADVVLGEPDALSDEGEALDLRLSDQHPVEGVPVVQGERANGTRVLDQDRQQVEARVPHSVGEVLWQAQPSCRRLDRDLPQGRDAHEHPLRPLRDPGLGRLCQRCSHEPPDDDVGVEEQSCHVVGMTVSS